MWTRTRLLGLSLAVLTTGSTITACGGSSVAKSPTGEAILSVTCSASDQIVRCDTLINNDKETLPAGKLEVELANKLSVPVSLNFQQGSKVVASVQMPPKSDKNATVDCSSKGAYGVVATVEGKQLQDSGADFHTG